MSFAGLGIMGMSFILRLSAQSTDSFNLFNRAFTTLRNK